MSDWLIIANPAAGNGAALHLRDKIEAAFQKAGQTYEYRITEAPGHAGALAAEYISRGVRHILVAGGDGTVHEAVNGIMNQSEVPTHEVSLGFLPLGTGCDWARTQGIPMNADHALRALFSGNTVLQDIGKVTYLDPEGRPASRYFNNVAGMAFDAFIVEQTLGDSKHGWRGKIFYLLGILSCLRRYQPQHVRVEGAGFQWEGRALVVNAGICRFSGGGMSLVPEALPDDGLLDITIIEDIGPWGVIKSIYRLYDGSIYRHPRAHHRRSPWLKVHAENEVLLECEGEWLGRVPAEFETVPGALRVRVG